MSDDDSATTRPSRSPRAAGERLWLPARYEDRGLIAVGGDGEVRAVWDLHLERQVALKILAEGAPDEGRLAARLQHPAIVWVIDAGVLKDGRRWFTMPQVGGQRLDEAAGTRPLPFLVRTLAQVASAVAYAHGQGLTHGDLTPANVLIGPHGEVQVLDWSRAVHDVQQNVIEHHGTPGYAAPEVLAGARPTPASDIYAMGALLALALRQGRRPFDHPDPAVQQAWQLAGRTVELDTGAHPHGEALVKLAQRCLARVPIDRPTTASEVRVVLSEWLDGAQQHEEATRLVTSVGPLVAEATELREEAVDLSRRARRLLATLPAHVPVLQRAPAWELQDQARITSERAVAVEAHIERRLLSALERAPRHAEGVRALAELRKARLIQAERDGDLATQTRMVHLLREDAPEEIRAWLEAPASVTITTVPAGRPIVLERYDTQLRYRTTDTVESGTSPIAWSVPAGSYRLRVSRGDVVVHLPLSVGRGDVWLPAEAPLQVPARLPPGTVFVPAGLLHAGGDPDAVDGCADATHHIPAFCIQRHPVTWRDYLGFLTDLRTAGLPWEALRPRTSEGAAMVVLQEGAFQVVPFGDGVPIDLDAPVSFVDFPMVAAYAAHRATADDIPWRLPHELEWERAARGADGRVFPWGHHFEPAWTCMGASHAGPPARQRVHALVDDISPFGLWGLAGNVRDWCANAYQPGGPAPTETLDPHETTGDPEYRMQRGGNWSSSAHFCRLTSRFGTRPERRLAGTGFRLAATLGPEWFGA